MATDTIRFWAAGRTATGTMTVDIYPFNSMTAQATGTAVSSTAVTGVYTFQVVSPTAGGKYRFIIRDSGVSPTWIGDGAFVAKDDGSTIDELSTFSVGIAPDAIGSTELATSAVTEIQAGLSTLDAIGVRNAVGLAAANLDLQLTTIDDYLDTEVSAIKAKTDNLPEDPADASGIADAFAALNTKVDVIDDFLDTEISAIKTVTDKYGSMVVVDGLVYQFTANALELGPSGGGGSGSPVYVYPLNASMPTKVVGPNITFYRNESGTVIGPIQVTSRNGSTTTSVDLSGRTLEVRIIDYTGAAIETITDVTVSGTGNDQFEFTVTTATTGEVTAQHEDEWHLWSLRDVTGGDDNVLVAGKARVLLA